MKMINITKKIHHHLHFKLVNISKHHVIYFWSFYCVKSIHNLKNLHAFLKDCKLNNSKKTWLARLVNVSGRKREFSAINLFGKLCTSQNNHVSEHEQQRRCWLGCSACPSRVYCRGHHPPSESLPISAGSHHPPTLPPVYPSVSQWEPFSFFLTATSHSSICVATVCSFSTTPKMTFIAAASLKQRPLMLSGTGSKQTELPNASVSVFLIVCVFTTYI